MNPRNHILLILIVFALIVAACGVPDSEPRAGAAAQQSDTDTTSKAREDAPTTTLIESKKTESTQIKADKTKPISEFDCPVTIPAQPGFTAPEPNDVTYGEHFPAPDPWPAKYPHEGMVWYGTKDLWTALDVDGDHGGRKSVWWSVNFPGGTVEETPDVYVTWTRLDTTKPVVIDNQGIATNAHTATEGWLMIAGIDPPEAGCWEVEATYKGVTLSYVYEK